MFHSNIRTRILNIWSDQIWSDLPQAFEGAESLQRLLEKSWPASTNTVATMLNHLRLAAYEAEHSYQHVRSDFETHREGQLKSLKPRLNLVGVLLLVIAACFCAVPLVFILLQVFNMAPWPLTSLYALGFTSAGMVAFQYALKLSGEQRHWQQVGAPACFYVEEYSATPLSIELMGHFLDKFSLSLPDWIKLVQSGRHPAYDHRGLAGELRLLRNLANLDLSNDLNEENGFLIMIHGLLLDEALDGDVILICSRGIFLLECKDWKDFTEYNNGRWLHMVRSNHPDAVHGWLYKEEVDPVAQFKREKMALDQILKTALPDIPEDEIETWQDGGVVFTHIAGDLSLENEPAVPCGNLDYWLQRIRDSASIGALPFAMQLRIAQALLNHATRSYADPEGVRDAADTLSEVFEHELDRLGNDKYFSKMQTYVDAYTQLIVEIRLEHNRLLTLLEKSM